MTIHIARGNDKLGQFTVEEANAGVVAGRFHASDLAWWEGAPGWVRLDTAPGVVVPANLPPPLPAAGAVPAMEPQRTGGMSTMLVVLLVIGGLLVIGVPVVGLLAAIAIPNFVQARTTAQKHACIANLKQIDGAAQQWALENRKTASDTYSLTDPALLMYLKGSVLPTCPAGGTYSAGPQIAEVPRCSISGHTL